ncbi:MULTISPECIES: cytochrome P450 [Streptomyces]|uniref:Cytochrome P450 n=1 Tax=Streptomyces eurythermus TaxID=42237 RepID=A0ABW6Z966_9ACTN|nr:MULTISPECIES: cytochrome P450 [Streptomyces]QIS68703.1 cytochrome P450 [Streptomyces sp. DSM 40868]
MTAALSVDLTDTELFVTGDPHAAWTLLRREAPVCFNPTEDGGFWSLTKYADVMAAYRDHTTFSSAHGAILGGSYRSGVDTASGRMLVAADPPQHRLLRKRMQRVFATAMVDRVRAAVRIRIDGALCALVAAGGGDFATDVALELPRGALMAMFGIDQDEAMELLGLTRAMIGYRDPAHIGGIENTALRLAAAQADIFDFFTDLVARRADAPGEDAVSILMSHEPGERQLSEETLLFNLMNLAVGGNETTPHSASGGVHALMENPDQWDRLVADPGVVPTAVDEVLRWTSTNAYVQRVVTKPVEVRGVALAEGDLVLLWNASANRDEEKFPQAHRFDIARKPNQHISFGSGLHHCIGAGTARPELTELLTALHATGKRLVPAGPPERLRSNFMLGIKHLPVEVTG